MILIEACCGSIEEALVAETAGADRIELCAALPTGGVTPSIGMLEIAKENLKIPIVAMVRPKEGRPQVSADALKVVLSDIKLLIKHGANEIITGFLDSNGKVDEYSSKHILDTANETPVAFHRVFDMSENLFVAIDTLTELGFKRVLTSGGKPSVDEGIEIIKQLNKHSNSKITVLPGGGVRQHNARRLVEYANCKELHFSFRMPSNHESYANIQDSIPDPNQITKIKEMFQ